MAPTRSSKLDGSWVVNDSDEGDISWADDSDSLAEDKTVTRRQRTPAKNSPQLSKGKSNHRVSLTNSGPELVMPSMSEFGAQSKRSTPSKRHEKLASISASQKKSKAVNNHSTKKEHRSDESTSQFADYLLNAISGTIEWLLDILGQSLKTLKKPISWVVAAYLFAGLLVLVQNLFFNSIYSAFSPLCRIPGVSLFHLPICRSPYDGSKPTITAGGNLPEPEFDALMSVQTQFEDILSDTATSVGLPWDMKRSEISMRDLRTVVTFANLQSKNELLHEFDGFIDMSKTAIWSLQKFNSHVGRGVDMVLSTARWTERVLDDISQRREERGIIPSFVSDKLLAPFQPIQFTESRLLDQYIHHTYSVSSEIERLIKEAQELLGLLQNLEDRLDTIHSISLRDKLTTQVDKDQVLSELYTYIGGNRQKLKKQNDKLKVLNEIIEYRKLAYAHIAAVVLKLQTMDTELEQLRTRVGSAAEMREAGIKDVPLSVHIEAIRLGVERLESKREETRNIEQKYRHRTFEDADGGFLEGRRDRVPLVDA